ncbi:MAG: DUF11 domain-containing protein, partial [Chloroflexi bacterium]|nr:DUF11 domain-containing protein [Chloroflexota bacterium]
VLTDVLPLDLAFNSASDGCTTEVEESATTVTCLLGELGGGGIKIVTISVGTPTEGTFTNTASVKADQLDTDETNDSGSATVAVAQPPATPPSVGGPSGSPKAPSIPTPEPEIASSHQDLAFLFTAPLGGPNPPTQTLSISNAGGRELVWFVSDSAEWLTLSPSIGVSEGEPDEVRLTVDVAGLPEGEYEAVITISSDRATNTPQTVVVNLIIGRFGGDIEISLSQETLSFTGPHGGPSPVGKAFEVWNAGGSTLDWVLESDVDWVVPSPTSGSSSDGARTTVTVNVDPLGLDAGLHEAQITITGEGAVNDPQTITVRFEVLPAPAEINIADTRFLFTAPESGPSPATQLLEVINSGGGDLNFVVGSDQEWLVPTPATGIANESAGQVGLVINVSDLEQGTYEALLEIVSVDAANSPQTVTVTLNVIEPTDTDGDGVPDVIELDAPNGGDSNGDGIPDVRQQNVSSLPDLVEGLFVTLESPEGTRQTGVSAIENPSPGDAPARVNFPIGFYSSTIEGLSRGGSTELVLTLDDPSRVSINKFYKFGPTPDNSAPHWYDFTYDGETGVEFIAGAFVIHLVDGLRGDDDLSDNGRIVSVGAPAFDRRSDLVMTRSPIPANVSTIQRLEYTVTITNEGPAVATDVLLLEEVPEEFDVVSAGSGLVSCTTVAGVECTLASLAEGASATFEIVLRARQVVEGVALLSSVSSGSLDPNVDNNTIGRELSIIAPSFGEMADTVTITAIELNPTPAARTLDIPGIGIGPLSWRIAPSCDPADAGEPLAEWLSVTPSSGISLESAQSIAIGVDISALAPGAYQAGFGVASDTALNGCQSVTVDLRLLSAIGRPKQSSVNLQTWELQGLSGIAKDFFELKREEVTDPAQQEWFTAAGELAGGLESDETIRRSLVNPTTDEKTALTSLSRFSETLGNWGPHNDVPVAVGEFTVDLSRKMAAILSGVRTWDPDALGIMEIGPTTGDLRLFAIYSKAEQAVFLHFDVFDPVPGQIDGIVPVSVEEDDTGALRLVASIEDGEFFSRRSPTLRAAIRSPGELRVFDELGRITGIVSEEITTSIPNSTYFRDFVTVLLASDSQADRFRYEITGFEEGLYGLDVIFTDTSGQVKTFPRTGVAITAGEVHSYELDWEILDEERGWSWKIDIDGDGSYDSEFPPPVVDRQGIPPWVWPEVVIGIIVFVIVLVVVIWIAVSWFGPAQQYASKISAPMGRVARRLGIRLRIPTVPRMNMSRWLRLPR